MPIISSTSRTQRPVIVSSVSKPRGLIYVTFKSENSAPPYTRLTLDAATRAAQRLNGMTAVKANWSALGSEPPNEKARKLAFDVLESSYSKGILEPSLVTASVEGGVGIVYKSLKRYAAIECLNRGKIQLLWFDETGTPQSRAIKITKKSIGEALDQIAALHAHA